MEREVDGNRDFESSWVAGLSGLMLMAGGLSLLLWPSVTVRVLASGAGTALTFAGALTALAAVGAVHKNYHWAPMAVESLWFTALGLSMLTVGETTVRALAVGTGVFLVVGGSVQIVSAATLGTYLSRNGRHLVRGLVALGTGVATVALAGESPGALAIALGAWLVAAGVLKFLHALAGGYARTDPAISD